MGNEYLPSIKRDEFDAFRVLASDLPTKFVEWEQATAQEKSKLEGQGYAVALIDVRPEEFAQHCQHVNRPGCIHELWIFARREAGAREAQARANVPKDTEHLYEDDED